MISERLAEIRASLGLNQTEMADLAGVKRDSWRRYEGGAMPTGEPLEKLASLGFSVDWLLTGHGQMRTIAPEIDARLKQIFSILGPEEIPFPGSVLSARPDLAAIREELLAVAERTDLPANCRGQADRILSMAFGDSAAAARLTSFEIGFWRGMDAGKRMPDRELLTVVLTGVETILSEDGTTLAPAKKAELVVTLYQLAQDPESRPLATQRSTIQNLIRLAS